MNDTEHFLFDLATKLEPLNPEIAAKLRAIATQWHNRLEVPDHGEQSNG